jgi:hypothetical protein
MFELEIILFEQYKPYLYSTRSLLLLFLWFVSCVYNLHIFTALVFIYCYNRLERNVFFDIIKGFY